jgi:hypothetical protein
MGEPAVTAWRDGMRRVNRAPAILLGVWVLTLLVSVPMAAAVRGMLEDHLGGSLAAETAASGVNYDWMQEFGDQATGLGVTFRPTIIGFGAVLDNLSAFLDNSTRPVVIVGAASAYVVLWIFLEGGILDRYARDRPTRPGGFFSASGVFFFRFLRLAAVQWLTYALLFSVVHRWLFDELYPRLIHEFTVERNAFFVRLGLYLLFGAMVAVLTTIFDYAKVRAIVEDRRSMIGAIRAGIGFITRHSGAAIGVFLVNFAAFIAVVAAYALVAPGVWQAGIMTGIAFAIGQAYVLARLWVKLVFWASETALFQSHLAHAGYVARAEPVWPESPATEALGQM